MKRIISLITIFLFLFAQLTGCIGSHNNDSSNKVIVYSFNGKNNTIELNNGIIIRTPESEKFIGGNITFLGEEQTDVKNYSLEFYFLLDGVKTTIKNDIYVVKGDSKASLQISHEMGTASGENILNTNKDAWDMMKNTLHFSLNGSCLNGDKFSYDLDLNVSEVFDE